MADKYQKGQMEYRMLGRTGLKVSVVGIGTCQLRLTPEKQAIDTLLKGFELGVNIVHTAPDYGNAEDIVSRAVDRTERKIIVASQGYDVPGNESGPVSHFESLFEATCARFGTKKLDLYGIACIDDREAHTENVWGANGMVEFLLRKKEEGRLGGIFCTTHGAAEYVSQLVTCGVFDAIMMAYNILGYHLLTCNPPPDRHFECLSRNRTEIFPLCQKHNVGLMIMKPLAGGFLCESDAFPPRRRWLYASNNLKAADALRSILINPQVACVMPGTASVTEAEENALSGYAPVKLIKEQDDRLEEAVRDLSKAVCSRCGKCDTQCSQGLSISWIFRAGLINLYPAAVFEQPDNVEYFRLHPRLESVCSSCKNNTCSCPSGINIPASLRAMHSQMLDLMKRGLIPPPDAKNKKVYGNSTFGAKILSLDVPSEMNRGETRLGRLYLENAGVRGWLPDNREHKARVVLGVFIEDKLTQSFKVMQDVHKGERWHFVFEITAPENIDRFHLRLQLLGEHEDYSEKLGVIVFSKTVRICSGSSNRIQLKMGAVSFDFNKHCMALTKSSLHFVERKRILWLNKFRSKTRRRSSLENERRPTYQTGSDPEPDLNSNTGSGEEALANNRVSTMPLYGVAWLDNNFPSSSPKASSYQVYLLVENRGSQYWHANQYEGKNVHLLIYVDNSLHRTVKIPNDVASGERVIITFPFTFPDTADNETWEIKLSFVEHNVAWFDQKGVPPLVILIRAEEAEKGPTAEAVAVAKCSNWGFWQPSQGITRSRRGFPYPLFVKQAQGCRIRDLDGNEWIDYVMAGGAAVLGYAHPAIQNAISQELSSSAVLTLPHLLEIKVTQMLCEMIPCAEMVLFGKHGSDACTAAIRIARLHTGRRKVLFSGYHGWHDWFVETLQPDLKMSPEPPNLFRFELNDLSAFRLLVKKHSGDIAAIIMEPAAQAANLEGPVCDIAPDFLREVARICREEESVFIFDEIITGFRYPKASVQQATGVIPDLTCLGKALSAGMPLSALVGRRKIMDKSLQAAYFPTFRGEAYSLAAAAAALDIYRSQDVPGKIQRFGSKLKNAINHIGKDLEVQGEMIGLPFRMIYKFHEPDELQRALKRTLLQQELLQKGILTYQGYMLPCIAHGEPELEQTVAAFKSALQRVQEVSLEQSFVRYLDIPLI